MKILVVDDIELARLLVERILARKNYEVVLAASGAEALELVRHGDIRLVVCDWNMPGIDGIEFCQELRKSNGLAYVYVIVVTARESREEMMVALWAGADDFIAKPFDEKELVLRVRKGERVINALLESETKREACQERLAAIVNA